MPKSESKGYLRRPTALIDSTKCNLGYVSTLGRFNTVYRSYVHLCFWRFGIVYLDDIVTFLSSFEQHMERVRILLNMLRKEWISVNLTMCSFRTEKSTLTRASNSTQATGKRLMYDRCNQWITKPDRHNWIDLIVRTMPRSATVWYGLHTNPSMAKQRYRQRRSAEMERVSEQIRLAHEET